MIDLYAAATSNSFRARIALEECGLSYKLHPVDLSKGEHKTPEYIKMNPMAQIPVIVDPEGPGGKPLTLAQSTAILMYAAEKSGGKFMPKDPAKRPAFLEALMIASTDITPTFGVVNGLSRAKEPHAPSVQGYKDRLKAMFKVWDDLLAKRKYAAGDEVTIADFSLYAGYARTKGAMAELVSEFKNVERWGNEIGARPATARAMKF